MKENKSQKTTNNVNEQPKKIRVASEKSVKCFGVWYLDTRRHVATRHDDGDDDNDGGKATERSINICIAEVSICNRTWAAQATTTTTKGPKMRQICAQSLFSSSHSTCLARPVQGTSLECVCKCVCVTTTTTTATKTDINNGVALEPSQGDRAVKVCDACDINQQRQCEFVNGSEREGKRRGRAEGSTMIDRLVESPQCLAWSTVF